MKFPLVITTTIRQFDVSQILIVGGSSCDIMYSKLFKKMNLERGNLLPCEGSNLQAFNGTTTCPWGYVEMVISVDDRKDVRSVIFKFLIVSCKSIHNCILERLFVVMLDVVASPIHLKIKYHNLQRELVTINVDLEGEKRVYQDLHKISGGRRGHGDQCSFPHHSAQQDVHPSSKKRLDQ